MLRSSGTSLLRALKSSNAGAGLTPSEQALVKLTKDVPAVVAVQCSTSSASAAPATPAAAAAGQQQQAAGGGSGSGSGSSSRPRLGKWGATGVGAAALAGLASFAAAEEESEHGLHSPSHPWPHDGLFSSFDHAAIRRGHQVYTQVCAACHSVQQLHYRNLVGVAYTEDEVKAMAGETEVEDGPNEEGEMFERPGRLSDPLPRPYANEEAARYANGGAYPPDLSLITKARHDGQNYVFSLLLGYRDPPAGVSVREGLYYNPYFPGGAIAMPKMLADGGTEYDDESPANEAQQAKDVTTFLAWAAEPEHDERKLMGAKWLFALSLVWVTAAYYKRWKWAPIKSRRVVVDAVN